MTDEHGTQDSDPGWHLTGPGDADDSGCSDLMGGAGGAGTGGTGGVGGTGAGGPGQAGQGRAWRRDAHPDIEALDAYLDTHPDPQGPGAPSGITASRVDRHLRSCTVCQETLTALRRVRAELAQLARMTMPEDVAERIQAALTARSGAVASSDRAAGRPAGTDPAGGLGDAADVPAADITPAGIRRMSFVDGASGSRSGSRRNGAGGRRGRPAGNRGSGARDWISIAAACVALVAFGAAVLAVRGLTSGTSAETTADAAVAAANPAEAGTFGAAAQPQREALPTAASSAANETTAAGGASAAGDGWVLVADTDEVLRPAGVIAHGQQLLAGQLAMTRLAWSALGTRSGSPEAAAPASGATTWAATAVSPPPTTGAADQAAGADQVLATTPESLARVYDTPQLRMCYETLSAQTGGSVLALDRVRFDDQQAIMLVLSVAGQPTVAHLVVIDAHCGSVPVPGAVWYSVNAKRG
ncbi:anti-sigma factor [Parafrankia sp. EUN1f]|uniref:anti-sigma factor family protein n=1 Tax=Parafrankia sp. EUN1f TaxID=102897 RepID=UPI000680573A|nr:hypothetical protein [Parafrankia sp. EUN1f]